MRANIFDKYLLKAKKYYSQFLIDGKMNRSLIKMTIDLAKIDTFYRTGGYYFPEELGTYDIEVVDDISRIMKNIDISKLEIKKRCVLNPDFNEASKKIGGADADLIIDNKLIDIKTTKILEISREMLNQMIGYYFLGKLGKVKGIKNWSSINEVAFYFSRFDLLYSISIDDIILKEKRDVFEKWFAKKLDKNYNQIISDFHYAQRTKPEYPFGIKPPD